MRLHTQASRRLAVAMVSMSAADLSRRMRVMRGKRRARPEGWRGLSRMESKAISRTTRGSSGCSIKFRLA